MSFVGDLRVVVRGRDFRRLYGTRLTSQATDGVFQVGLASLFFFSPERQTTAGQVAAAFAVLLLPYSLVGPFAGVLLDRWRRRQILVRANLLRAAMVVAVAALVAGGTTGPALYAAVLACLSVNRFFLAGLSASLPHVVPRHELVMANSVSTTSGTLAAITGGGLGYLLRRLLPEGSAGDARLLLLASLGYLVAAALAARMHPDLLGPDTDDGPDGEGRGGPEGVAAVLRDLVAGAAHVRDHRPAAHALGAIAAHRLAYGISTIAVILLARNYLNDPADVDAGLAFLAQVVATSGLGFLLAAVLTPPAVHRMGKRSWIVACFVGAAAVEYVFVVSLHPALILLGAFFIGFAAQGSKICVDTIVQESVDDAFRGRVFSFYDVLFNVTFVSAAAVAAATVPADGDSRPVYAAIATIYLGAAAGYAAVSRRTPVPEAGTRS